MSNKVVEIQGESLLASATMSILKGELYNEKSLLDSPVTFTHKPDKSSKYIEIPIKEYISDLQGTSDLYDIMSRILNSENKYGVKLQNDYSDVGAKMENTPAMGLYFSTHTQNALQCIANCISARYIIDTDDKVVLKYISGTDTKDKIIRNNIKRNPNQSKARDVSNVTSVRYFFAPKDTEFYSGEYDDYKSGIAIYPENMTRNNKLAVSYNPLQAKLEWLKITLDKYWNDDSSTTVTINDIYWDFNASTTSPLLVVDFNFVDVSASANGRTKVQLYGASRTLGTDSFQTVNFNSVYGQVCDVNNVLGEPEKPQVLIDYYSNRTIYDLTVRGNPAWDVGDYVDVESAEYEADGETRKTFKALILSRTLTYDGVFTDKLQVRRIDKEFEDYNADDVIISNVEEFKAFIAETQGGNTYAGKRISLIADIELDGTENNIQPILDFAGKFNGRGHTISGVNISSDSLQYLGLFAGNTYGTIDNVEIVDCKITNTYSSTPRAGIIGALYGKVRNCRLDGEFVGTYTAVIAQRYVGAKQINVWTMSTVTRPDTTKTYDGLNAATATEEGYGYTDCYALDTDLANRHEQYVTFVTADEMKDASFTTMLNDGRDDGLKWSQSETTGLPTFKH
jgi:hypothetical protein